MSLCPGGDSRTGCSDLDAQDHQHHHHHTAHSRKVCFTANHHLLLIRRAALQIIGDIKFNTEILQVYSKLH